jgi:hypothetical protein
MWLSREDSHGIRTVRGILATFWGLAFVVPILASAALAQGANQPVADGTSPASGLVRPIVGAPRKVGQAYAERLLQMPDLNGAWNYTTPNPRAASYIFDPANAFIPYDLPPGIPEYGPRPGTYIKGIPYKAEYQRKYAQIVKNTSEGRSIDPYAACNPYGMPRLMGGIVGGFDLLEGPDLIIMHFPFDNEVRKIFLDGRPHPDAAAAGGAAANDEHTWTGHSVGRWDGDTLVVDTVNMLPGYYDQTDAPTSAQVHLIERFRLLGANTLENQMTIEDPVMLTRPWQVTRLYQRAVTDGRAGEAAAAAQGDSATAAGLGAGRYRNLQDVKCVPTVTLTKGYQSAILPQELEARRKARVAKTSRK